VLGVFGLHALFQGEHGFHCIKSMIRAMAELKCPARFDVEGGRDGSV